MTADLFYLSLGIFVCVHVCVQVPVLAGVGVGQRSMLSILLCPAAHHFLRQVPSLNLELADVPTVAGEQAPTVLWPLPPQGWNQRL